MSGYGHAVVDDIPEVAPAGEGEGAWKPVRHHFGIRAFGVNAWIAREAGEIVVEDHDETASGGTAEHEELYAVIRGSARFTVGDETFEAPAGTLVHVGDPALRRVAVAAEPDTAVLAVGAAPGAAFTVSPWEAKHH